MRCSFGSWRESGAGAGEGVGSGQGLKDRASCGSVLGWGGVCGLSVVSCGSFRAGGVGMRGDGGGGRGNEIWVDGKGSNESGCARGVGERGGREGREGRRGPSRENADHLGGDASAEFK